MQWHEYPDAESYTQALVKRIAADLRHALAREGHARLALSGGRSPIPLLEALNREELDWAQVVVTLVDDRCVPATHADSNARLLQAHFFQHAAAVARFEPLIHDANNADASVQAANRAAGKITVAVLGMGEDGHTASLFPGAAELAAGLDSATQAHYLAVTPPVAPHRRVSLTLAALCATEHLYLAISGANKRTVFERAGERCDINLPISYLIHQTRTPLDVYWMP